MNGEVVINKLKQLESPKTERSIFSKIMEATTVGELLDLQLKSEEVFSLFEQAEILGRMEYNNILFAEMLVEKIKQCRPEKSGRRALFI